jgi:hypothetical protein
MLDGQEYRINKLQIHEHAVLYILTDDKINGAYDLRNVIRSIFAQYSYAHQVCVED